GSLASSDRLGKSPPSKILARCITYVARQPSLHRLSSSFVDTTEISLGTGHAATLLPSNSATLPYLLTRHSIICSLLLRGAIWRQIVIIARSKTLPPRVSSIAYMSFTACLS